MSSALALLLCAGGTSSTFVVPAAHSPGGGRGPLSDDPLHGAGDALFPLADSWTLRNAAGSFSAAAVVPGDIVSDLERSGGYGTYRCGRAPP